MGIFRRRPESAESAGLEGVVTFFNSYNALRAESVLKKSDLKVRLIPGPREISPNCGVALRFDYAVKDLAARILSDANVQIEKIHFYPDQS